ncbi:hypothetical protein RFI_22270 [Reticulomyxa filosa]|uniref:TRAF-type domain-containing protein n=1 Tax=Reticulomyxa filosa TaxID=46433 RepID=X6MPS3_RETFI|nr:hypothetical protein RFI_22270 [Reticulomyxa filosa]|eukprot:ETO15095.1 hypothetical protein RFI_22270 [Reticulomyxa filosa]
MSKVEEEKLVENKIGVSPVPFERACFDKNWILGLNQLEQINALICLICKQVANNPVEISCDQHKDMKQVLVAGECCLEQFLGSSDDTCPVQAHCGCAYNKTNPMQQQIDDLMVTCPRQFEQSVKSPRINENEQMPEKNMTMACNFKGKMKDLKSHLDSSCPLKLVNCWFKPFECHYSCLEKDLEDHLSSEMKHHFDLVMKRFESMQDTIQQQQVVYIYIYIFFFSHSFTTTKAKKAC